MAWIALLMWRFGFSRILIQRDRLIRFLLPFIHSYMIDSFIRLTYLFIYLLTFFRKFSTEKNSTWLINMHVRRSQFTYWRILSRDLTDLQLWYCTNEGLMMTLPGVNAKITTKDSCIPEANTNKKQQIIGIIKLCWINWINPRRS